MKRILKYFSIVFFGVSTAKAQLLVSPNNNANALVNQIVGNNVTITNAVLKCNKDASGMFISNNSNIGLNNGIILTTGKATGAIGPNSKKDHGECFSSQTSQYADPDIINIEPEAKYDGCILEFDIVPICNTLQIKYVFGSEEYPEYVGTKFNDVFGFFVSGPNPGGGNYNGYNIARLAGGTPVAINTINNGSNNSGPCTNCAFYINNTNGQTIQYDGFTTPLTASVNVTPCATYHLKLAIADAGDCDYDSGVFLEYQGISCANSQIPVIATNTTASFCDLNNGSASVNVNNYNGGLTYNWSPGGQATANASNLAPGTYVCTLSFQLPCPYTKTVSVQVPHNTGFNANSAVTNIICPQHTNGSATVTPLGGSGPYTYSWTTNPVQTSSIAVGLGMGQYTCSITDAVGCTKNEIININPTTTLKLNPTSEDALCNNNTGTASGNASGGTGPYIYTWNTTPVQNTETAVNLFPGSYSVTVTDNVGCTVSAIVDVNNHFPVITINDSIVHATCGNSNGSIYIKSLSGGTSPYQFLWQGGETTQDITQLPPGTYSVSVSDQNNCLASKTFIINNLDYLPIIAKAKDDICEQKKGNIQAGTIGGTGPYTYSWMPGSVSSQSTSLLSNIGQGTYTVTITDALGCTNSQAVTVNNYNDEFTGYAEISPRIPQAGYNFTVTMYPGSIWYINSALTKDNVILRDNVNVLNYSEFGSYYIVYFMESENGCKFTYKFDYFVKDFMTLYFPNTFTPNGDGLNDAYRPVGTLVKEFNMQIYDRWGQKIFNTDDLYKGWDGTFKGKAAQQDVYIYKAQAIDYFEKRHDFTGHINLIR